MPLYTFMPVKKEGKPLFLLQVKKKKAEFEIDFGLFTLDYFLMRQ